MWFSNGSYKNWAVQSQKQARNLKFRIFKSIRVAKTKALISFAVTAKLICVFVFAYADCWFSPEAAHMVQDNVNVKHISGNQNIRLYMHENEQFIVCYSSGKLFHAMNTHLNPTFI